MHWLSMYLVMLRKLTTLNNCKNKWMLNSRNNFQHEKSWKLSLRQEYGNVRRKQLKQYNQLGANTKGIKNQFILNFFAVVVDGFRNSICNSLNTIPLIRWKKEKERSLNSGDDDVTQTSSPGGWQAKLSALNFFHLQVSSSRQLLYALHEF